MTTAIAVSVISSTIVLLITLLVKDYVSKSKEANTHRHLIEINEGLRENLKEKQSEIQNRNKEITELKNEVEFSKDKNDKQEEYIFILRAHISDPPPLPESITREYEIE